jgi:tryptophan-rich sensory protein
MHSQAAEFRPLRRDWLALGACFLSCFAVAGIGGLFTSLGLGPWYQSLSKPAWNPPNWVFGPVWTTLYATMAVACWLVWRRREIPQARVGLWLFAAQLMLNLGWSILFFGMRAPSWAFFEILLLWTAIATTLVVFWRVRPLAGILLIPYLLWVGFAAILNGTIILLNS